MKNPFPKFPLPAGMTIDDYFEQICREGWRKRRDTAIAHLEARGILRNSIAAYEERLTREIDCIKNMKFPGYFMIVWDFIRYAKEHAIPVGPGRGSAAGSLVAYVMEITDIDPLQNNLLFERFLNPERVSMPDVDIDFCMNRRGEVIEYVREKYGVDQVAQIITFNTMAAKAAIKDVGRAMDMPYGARRGGPCGGGGDRTSTVDGACARNPYKRRGHCHQLRHEGGGKDGPAQDGLSWADHADSDRRLLKANSIQSRRNRGHGDGAAR